MILPNTSPWVISFEVRVPSALTEHWLSPHATFFPWAFLLLLFFFLLYFSFSSIYFGFHFLLQSRGLSQGSHILGKPSVTEP